MTANPVILSRRGVLGAAAGGVLLTAGGAAAAPARLRISDIVKEADTACIYHCDFGDGERFSQMLTNISNHYSVYGADPFALQILLIAHGPGVKFFLADRKGTPWEKDVTPSNLTERVLALSKNGLKVYLCEITFQRTGIDPSRALEAPYIAFVPSGVATIAALQGKGFAYLKVG